MQSVVKAIGRLWMFIHILKRLENVENTYTMRNGRKFKWLILIKRFDRNNLVVYLRISLSYKNT